MLSKNIGEFSMRKKGFTLAEILITLGIIGVVAALAAPALTKNSGQAKLGPALSKFVNTFENASGLMMQQEGMTKLIESNGDSLPMEQISKHMVVVPSSESYTYYAPGGGEGGTVDSASVYVLKDGSIMAISPVESITEFTDKGAFKGIVADIIYDINGNAGKNRAGKDVFRFVLDNSGTLVPYGSNAYKYLYSSFETECSADADASLDAGLACTGRIADNAWKADY